MALTINSTGVVIVDDLDPRIRYDGHWILGGTLLEYDSTTHGAITDGSTATFIFTGTSVAVYGTYGVEGTPSSIYTVDGISDTINAPPVTSAQHQVLFYQSPVLDNKEHRLVITARMHGIAVYWLDYIVYLPSAAAISPPSFPTESSPPVQSISSLPAQSTPPSPTTMQTASLSGTSIHTDSPSAMRPTGTPTSAEPLSSNFAGVATKPKTPSTAAVVGGVMGALLFLVLIVLAVLIRKWPRSSRRMQAIGLNPILETRASPPPTYPFAQSGYRYDYSIQKRRDQGPNYSTGQTHWDERYVFGNTAEHRPDNMSYDPPSTVELDPPAPGNPSSVPQDGRDRMADRSNYPASRHSIDPHRLTSSGVQSAHGSNLSDLYLPYDDPRAYG